MTRQLTAGEKRARDSAAAAIARAQAHTHPGATMTDHPAPAEARISAALEVLGWPDDRKMSAHVEPDGFHITPPGHYWQTMSDVLTAAELAAASVPSARAHDEATDEIDRLAATLRRYRKVVQAAQAWRRTEALPDYALDDQERALIVAVDALGADGITQPAQSHAAGPTAPPEGDGIPEPAQTVSEPTDADSLTWDYREQPDLDDLARILARHGVHLEQVDTGSDQYEIRISSTEAARAQEIQP